MDDVIDLNENNIEKPKKIGTLDGKPVFLIMTKGGLSVVAATKGASMKILGLGSHQAISKHIAQKKEPNIVFESLQKSEVYPLYAFKDLLSSYEELTDKANKDLNG